MLPAPAADVDPKLARKGRETALESAYDAGGDARGVPVHPHHGPERLKPEGVGQPAQQLVPPVMQDNGLAQDRGEAGHPVREPLRHSPAMQGKVGASGSSGHGSSWSELSGSTLPQDTCRAG